MTHFELVVLLWACRSLFLLIFSALFSAHRDGEGWTELRAFIIKSSNKNFDRLTHNKEDQLRTSSVVYGYGLQSFWTKKMEGKKERKRTIIVLFLERWTLVLKVQQWTMNGTSSFWNVWTMNWTSSEKKRSFPTLGRPPYCLY